MKAQSQEKDTVIIKLKDRIKYLSGKDSMENIKKDMDGIETINIELEHNQFDSIRKIRVQSKEQGDSLIAQISAKSIANSDLNAQLQEKVFAIATLKNKLRKLKGKNVVNTVVSKPNTTIAPGMFKLDIEPISHRLKNNRDPHEVYIKKTIENTDTLRGFVERARTHNPSDPLLESACMFTKHVQELFAEPVISLSNIPKQTDSLKTKDSNKPLLISTGVKPTTSASGSKRSSNTRNNRITQPPSRNQKNKIEDHSRKVKSSLNKMNSVSEHVNNALVKYSMRNAKFESMCTICNKCLFDANHDMCIIDYVNDVNVRSKSKSKRNKMRKVWKPTVIAPEPAVLSDTPSSTTIDQDAPSTSTSQTPQETPSPVFPLSVEEAGHDIEVAHIDNNLFVEFPILEPSSEESSTQVVIPNHVHSINQPPEHIDKWTKDHMITGNIPKAKYNKIL
ncbi:hypothetical protein Tco_0608767 [Tanacetum coccineum]